MQLFAATNRKFACRFIAVLALAQPLMLTAWGFPGQSKINAVQTKPAKNEGRHMIDRLEEKWRNAVLSNDAAALDSLMADDYVAIQSSGMLMTKDQTLAAVRDGKWHITSLELSDRKVRFYGRTAVVTSIAQIEGSTQEGLMTGSYRYTRVYARDNRGNWRIVNFEASRIGHGHHPSPNPGSSN